MGKVIIEEIPAGCEVKFVGEGAANAVFKIGPPPTDRSNRQSSFQGKLLRVPKAGTNAYPHRDLQEYWERAVRPLFSRDDLVGQSLIRLSGTGDLVSRLNALLSENEDSRREDFRGHRVADAEYGMLVEDMTKVRQGDVALEFKPKWLTQSPSAPPWARRCRTCAREACRNNNSHKNSNGSHGGNGSNGNHGSNGSNNTRSSDCAGTGGASAVDPILCPLNLPECAGDPAALARVVDHLVRQQQQQQQQQGAEAEAEVETIPAAQLDRLAEWLAGNNLINRLRGAQARNDARGPLAASPHDPRFQLAMTLRDCTCFVRIPADAGRPVEAKLGDLDKKNWEAKLAYWRSTEQRLINEGYYEGVEKPPQETFCQLGKYG